MPDKKKKDDLDTETTIVDMNVEGFRWYDPSKKAKSGDGKNDKPKVSRKEFWKMVRAAYAAYLPVFGIILLAMAVVIIVAVLWVY